MILWFQLVRTVPIVTADTWTYMYTYMTCALCSFKVIIIVIETNLVSGMHTITCMYGYRLIRAAEVHTFNMHR